MRLPEFSYLSPKSLSDACRLLKELGEQSFAIAGGTDLMLPMKEGVKVPECLVDLKDLPGFHEISYTLDKGLLIGPMVSLRNLARSPEVRKNYPSIAKAALEVASAQLQAMGTVGGNICQDCLCLYYNRSAASKHDLERCYKAGGDVCHTVKGSKDCWATFCSDLAPALLVMGAQVKVADASGERLLPLENLYTGDGKRPNILRAGWLVSQIIVPPPVPNTQSSYQKLRLRKTIDYPALGVAVSVTPLAARFKVMIGLTGVERKPLLLEAIYEKNPNEAIRQNEINTLAEKACNMAHPLNNLREFTPRYRKQMVKVYVKTALEQMLSQTEQ